ncbi:MAG: hypothetical protein H6555_11060 [Lewinellaceae bacterium]|nr:hypothetical protein [Lewinellaceae bacterium]
MSKAANSIFIYSLYLFMMGLALMIIPNHLLAIFDLEPTSEIWIKVLGLFAFTTGIYYYYSSRHEQVAFYTSTVAGRIFFFVALLSFVLIFQVNPVIALIGSVDLVGALWTLWAIRQHKPG